MRVIWDGTFDSTDGFLYLSSIPHSGLFIAYGTLTQKRTLRGCKTPEEGHECKTGYIRSDKHVGAPKPD